ncbi:MAG: replication protein RepA [Hyphomicrobiaceae bacterium]
MIDGVRDADLVAELERHRNLASFGLKRKQLEEIQAKRDQLSAVAPAQRRRLAARATLDEQPIVRDDLRHIHSVLAICGLPYRRLPGNTRDFERRQGNMALDVSAGFLRDTNGNKILQPVPFGPKARLILMHLCSEAVRQKSATIDIADTFTGFVRDLGFNDSGGKRGALTAFREQLNALSACTMRMSVWTGQRVRTRTISPIEDIDLWLALDPHQRSLWPSTVTFSPAMFDSLKRHALPVNVHAIRAFAGSARKIDLYFWLGWRLYSISAKTVISWEALAQQFGDGYGRQRDFMAALQEDLRHIQEVFPKLPVFLDQSGIHLEPADPQLLALPLTA